MPSFLTSEDPPQPSQPVDDCVEDCPLKENPVKFYRIQVFAGSRAGDLVIPGLDVQIDGASIGRTDAEGKSPPSALRSKGTADIRVVYSNAGERLKSEVFTLPLTGIDAEAKSYSVGMGKNFIAKVQDVFGSGEGSMQGDLDFEDEYEYPSGMTSMEDTEDPDIKLIKVAVRMATISLQVPYISQVGAGESVVTSPPTPANPAGSSRTFRGSIICMPTSTTMLLHYWNITDSTGAVARQTLMQRAWDEHSSPSATYPCPWQNWAHLRDTTSELTEESDPGMYTVTNGPSGTDGSIPGAYADGIVGELIQGRPVVTSTYATDGHVMAVRGAVIDHEGHAQWLIFNDPYGNLASPKSIYNQLDISAPVGLRGNSTTPQMNLPGDVRGVREVLNLLGHYDGPMDGPIDETDPADPTVVAIKAFQGGPGKDGRVDPGRNTERRLNSSISRRTSNSYSTREEERNAASGDGADLGRHVYYSSHTEAKGTGGVHRFKLKTEAWTLVIEKSPALTPAQIRDLLIPGQ